MLTVTKKAAALLKAAKSAVGAPSGAGVRIVRGGTTEQEDTQAVKVGFAISEDPIPGDEALEQDGLRIFVDENLVDPLDGRTLDVGYAEGAPELIFR
jgi:Fe-S cluster assembly iron-binding protein IscA